MVKVVLPSTSILIFRLSLTFVGIAQVFDVLSTRAALAAGSVEINPLAAAMQHHLGEAWGVPKLMMGAIAIATAWRLSPQHITPAVFWLAVLFAKLYALVILNNYLQVL